MQVAAVHTGRGDVGIAKISAPEDVVQGSMHDLLKKMSAPSKLNDPIWCVRVLFP